MLSHSTLLRINRNIVECKSLPFACGFSFVWSINRNIVECKSRWLSHGLSRGAVLIETLWNVNFVPGRAWQCGPAY